MALVGILTSLSRYDGHFILAVTTSREKERKMISGGGASIVKIGTSSLGSVLMIAMRRSSCMGLLPFLLLGFCFTLRQSYLFLDTASLVAMHQQQQQTQQQQQRQPQAAILHSLPILVTENDDKPLAADVSKVEEEAKPISSVIRQSPPPPPLSPVKNDKMIMNNNNSTLQHVGEIKEDDACPPHCFPKIVWLLSFPNSGTSYTMSLTERASNKSFASNYGDEVTARGHVSLPVHMEYPTGPFWEGISSAANMGRLVRPLPDKYVLTKTHCGGRCINCGPTDGKFGYIISTPLQFLHSCARSHARITPGKPGAGPDHNTSSLGRKMEFQMEYKNGRVAKVIHLIRHPIHNIVSRFHLDRKNRIRDEPALAEYLYLNATGFRRWCTMLDMLYASNPNGYNNNRNGFHPSWDNTTRILFQQTPCRAEFYKYTQWHNGVLSMRSLLFKNKNNDDDDDSAFQNLVLTIHYEDYVKNLTSTLMSILNFLEQERVVQGRGTKLREFKEKEMDRYYQDYFTPNEYIAIYNLIRHVASKATWKRIQHYFSETATTTTQTVTS